MINSLKYDLQISDAAIRNELSRLINQTYKLLPYREEEKDWQTPLTTILIELKGMNDLTLLKHDQLFFTLCSKLEALNTLSEQDNYEDFRSTVFKCLSLLKELKDKYERL